MKKYLLAAFLVFTILVSGCMSGDGNPGITEYDGDEVYLDGDGELKNYSGLLRTHWQGVSNTSYTLDVRDSWTLFVESNATILGRNVTEVVKKKSAYGVLVRNETRVSSEGRRRGGSNVFGTEHRRVTRYWLPGGENTSYVRVNSTYPGERNFSGVSPGNVGVRYPLEGEVTDLVLTGTGEISYRGYNVTVLEVRASTRDADYVGSIYVDSEGVIHKISFREMETGRWDHELRLTLKRVGETAVRRPGWVTGVGNTS